MPSLQLQKFCLPQKGTTTVFQVAVLEFSHLCNDRPTNLSGRNYESTKNANACARAMSIGVNLMLKGFFLNCPLKYFKKLFIHHL